MNFKEEIRISTFSDGAPEDEIVVFHHKTRPFVIVDHQLMREKHHELYIPEELANVVAEAIKYHGKGEECGQCKIYLAQLDNRHNRTVGDWTATGNIVRLIESLQDGLGALESVMEGDEERYASLFVHIDSALDEARALKENMDKED